MRAEKKGTEILNICDGVVLLDVKTLFGDVRYANLIHTGPQPGDAGSLGSIEPF